MLGQVNGTMQQTRGDHVIDEGTFAHGELVRFVLDAAATDAPRLNDYRDFTGGDVFDRVEDFDVAGATAQMGAKQGSGVLAGEIGALLVDHCLGAHDDARGAETALQRAVRGKCCRHRVSLGAIHTFEGEHFGASRFLQRRLTGNTGLAIHHDRATAALTARRAAILGRHDS